MLKLKLGDLVLVSRIEGTDLEGAVMRLTKTKVVVSIPKLGGTLDFNLRTARETGIKKGTTPYTIRPKPPNGSLGKVGGRPPEADQGTAMQQLRDKYLESYEVYKSRCHLPTIPATFISWYTMMQDDYNRVKQHIHDPSLEEFIKRRYGRPPKIEIDELPARKLEDTISPKPTQNTVQWVPRDPITGDERIQITKDGHTREYLFFSQAHLPVSVVHLQYLDERFNMVTHSLALKGLIPFKCTCKDHKERKVLCKHIKALTVALPKRPEPLHFE